MARILVGVDEAGYGPTLGPLVLGTAVFRLDEGVSPQLYGRLARLVTRDPRRAGQRLVLDDSKALFTGRRSLALLERGALAFLHPEQDVPRTLPAIVKGVQSWPRWYREPPGAARDDEMPVVADAAGIRQWRTRLRRELPDFGVHLEDCKVLAVLAGPFNRSVERTGNKAASLLEFLSSILGEILQRYPDDDLTLRIDRLGGRRYYEGFLGTLFPLRRMRTLRESAHHSAYSIRDGKREIEVSFEIGADTRHLPVALASMCAKYVRELFLRRLNNYFAGCIKDLRPTAGYPQDARRFLADVEPALSAEDRPVLVRSR